ncbi:hydroxymethylbilane synthase [Teichococcus aestuarii]|uniref:Porphobilinogen deaminase n=1 Tax=Teichococcus aestuarii TaxID=568898 RepID=A0A2U1V198_9PROT|nr:hydroxymethylbilane synthase [Pseudoroseomonas aestuarii]PWC27669.1 hydroxymethylbilane synthase [Pseudoroseomonas aestuarii]
MSAALQAAPALARPSLVPARSFPGAPLRAGTRASPLALAQTRRVLAALGVAPGEAQPVPMQTSGDAEQRRRLADLGGKGLFAKEIHEALLDGRVAFAVHSLKDLETELPPGLVIAAVLPRADARDALVLAPGCPPEERRGPLPGLPSGARIGTASARRMAQLRHLRPDLRFGLLRGNVQTRLRRLEEGDHAATVLAMAGLQRLELEARAARPLSTMEMLPAAGQGIIAVTARAGDSATRARLAGIDHSPTHLAARAERAVLAALDGSCRTPIGAHASLTPDGALHLEALVAREDGSFLLRRALRGAPADAERLGAALGASLRADSPADLFA